MRDNVREFLDSLRTNKAEIELRKEQIAQLEAAATRMTTAWKDVSVSGHGDPHKDDTMIALADARNRLLDEETQLAQSVLDVTEFVNKINYVTYRTILYLRYVECLTWPEVIDKLEQMNMPYAERHVYRLHGSALNAARRLWAEEKGEEQ